MKGPSARWILFFVLIGSLSLVVGLLAWRYPDVLEGRDSQIKLVHATLLLSAFLIPTLYYQKIKASQALKAAAIWIAIGFVVFTGYAFRDEASFLFQRLAGELIPGMAQNTGSAMVVRMGRDGHFEVEAEVDGKRVKFLIDTGASDVVLSPKDATRLGFDLTQLDYSKTYLTANGKVKGAPVTLGQISIGALQVKNVAASVNGADMNRSLLGMSYLRRLSGFEMDGNSLILTP